MSEYQYYEFQAIDHSLTEKEMGELRACSSRARITATSFVNEYNWGDFKGDEDAWMDRYFDAHLYLANWGTHVVKLRLPATLLDLETARQYLSGESVSAREKGGKVILTFHLSGESDGGWVEGEGTLAGLISVRAELARGDLRALYLGWLLSVQNDERDDDELEPPVPAGLGKLSGALKNLADFLQIDPDLIAAAAEASPSLSDATLKSEDVLAWLATLPACAKDDLIARLMTADESAGVAEWVQRFIRTQQKTKPGETEPPRRTAGHLRHAAETRDAERRQMAAKEAARRERKAAIARAKYLDTIVASRSSELWQDVAAFVTAKPARYDEAVPLLVDLRDAAARGNASADFQSRFDMFRACHRHKSALLRKLQSAGL